MAGFISDFINSIVYSTVNDTQDSHKHIYKYISSQKCIKSIKILSHFLLEQNATKSKAINTKHTQRIDVSMTRLGTLTDTFGNTTLAQFHTIKHFVTLASP